MRAGDTVKGTVTVDGPAYERLQVALLPRVVSPTGQGNAYGLERVVELEPEDGPIRFEVEVPSGPPAWKGEALRVTWRVFAYVHPPRGGATSQNVPLLVEPLPGARPLIEVTSPEDRRESGGSWAVLGLANVIAAWVAYEIAQDDPWVALALSPVLLLDVGVIGSAVSAARTRRLASTVLAVRAPDGRSPYRDGPARDPELQLVVTEVPEGTRSVAVELRGREQWRESTGGKGYVNHGKERYAERAVLAERGGEWVASVPMPDFAELGWTIETYAAGVRWNAVLEVVVAGASAREGTTLRSVRAVVVTPMPG